MILPSSLRSPVSIAFSAAATRCCVICKSWSLSGEGTAAANYFSSLTTSSSTSTSLAVTSALGWLEFFAWCYFFDSSIAAVRFWMSLMKTAGRRSLCPTLFSPRSSSSLSPAGLIFLNRGICLCRVNLRACFGPLFSLAYSYGSRSR